MSQATMTFNMLFPKNRTTITTTAVYSAAISCLIQIDAIVINGHCLTYSHMDGKTTPYRKSVLHLRLISPIFDF